MATAKQPHTRSAYHHGDLEEALVREALDVVRRRGADDVSLRRVAQTLGVSPSAAYAHFPDKHSLMVAVAHRGMDTLDIRVEAVGSITAASPDADVVRHFRMVGVEYIRFAVEESHLFRHIFGPCSLGEPPSGPDEMKKESTSYRMLCEVLDELDRRRLLREGAREGLDLVAWTMMHGFASLLLDDHLPAEAGPVVSEALARLALADHALPLLDSTR
jgi:AcrR family transcriptional regulator